MERKKKAVDQMGMVLCLLALSFCQCNASLVTAGSPDHSPSPILCCAVSRLAAAGWFALPPSAPICPPEMLLLPAFGIYPGASFLLRTGSRAAV